jgi:hypothetical protein
MPFIGEGIFTINVVHPYARVPLDIYSWMCCVRGCAYHRVRDVKLRNFRNTKATTFGSRASREHGAFDVQAHVTRSVNTSTARQRRAGPCHASCSAVDKLEIFEFNSVRGDAGDIKNASQILSIKHHSVSIFRTDHDTSIGDGYRFVEEIRTTACGKYDNCDVVSQC